MVALTAGRASGESHIKPVLRVMLGSGAHLCLDLPEPKISRGYAFLFATTTTLIYVTMIRLMVRSLAKRAAGALLRHALVRGLVESTRHEL